MAKVMVVDDAYSELQVMESILRSAGHDVVTYLDGDQLEEKIVKERPDVVLLDIVMPKRNGFEVLRALRKDERSRVGPTAGRRRVSAQAVHPRPAADGRAEVRAVTTNLLDTPAAIRACVFTLAGMPYAIDVTQVREVAIFDEWTVMPLAPPNVLGVANLRGDVVAIVDARPLFGLPSPRAGRRQWTLVVAAEGLEAALVIDGVARLEAFTGVVPLDDPSAPHAPWTQGVLTGGEGRVPLLGSAKLLRALREER